MLDVARALEILLDAVAPLPAVEVGRGEALGAVLAEDILADRDLPPADRSAMDGFAVRSADAGAASLEIVGEIAAGSSAAGLVVGPGQAVRIFTGGVLPGGADAVAIQERAEVDPAAKSVRLLHRPLAGDNIRMRGEDVRAGQVVLARGTRIGPAQIATIASVGGERIVVHRRPRVAVASTGDELAPPGSEPAPHQVRDSNAAMLVAQTVAMGIAAVDLGRVADDARRLDEAIAAGLERDVLLLSGGVSVGAYDLVAPALARAGCTTLFHGVAMRPGKPLLAATRGGSLVFGLPGNPVSAFTAFHLFAAPALRRLGGDAHAVLSPVRATVREAITARPGRRGYLLARLAWEGGRPVVSLVRSASSGDVVSLSRANALVVTPADGGGIASGGEADVLAWGEGSGATP